MLMADQTYRGVLLIGDPHLDGRIPGFRKDNYPDVILEKLKWSLEYAARQQLLPAILGDLFDKPRDNPNWMIVRLLEILNGEVLGLYGNHDVHYNPQLTPDDSLSLLVTSGKIRLLSPETPWRGTIGGRPVVIGGSSYRQPIPENYEKSDPQEVVIWLTHHDILIPGYDEGRIRPREISGIDLLINGHIHRRLEEIVSGGTTWLTPGNISRRARSDASRSHIPSVLQLEITPETVHRKYVEVPHRPFDEVFHEAVVEMPQEPTRSEFIAGLAELQARRTESGAGLMEFLQQNLGKFDAAVAKEIQTLANEVMEHGEKSL
jgi:DNA repair exonuclease SbcCD nuclease subunit